MYQFPMHFPHGFNVNVARELAYLVSQAYAELSHPLANPVSGDPPAPLGISARDYTDVVPLSGTIRLRPRIWNWLVRVLRLPGWLVPARDVVEPFGFVARRDACVYLVFRGTKTRADWWEDLHMEQRPVPADMLPKGGPGDWSGAAVESGVLELYLTMRAAVLDSIRQHAPPLRVYVTGHSLGACLAKLAVPDLIANTAFTGDFKPVVYNFGQPRFVNSAFARAFVTDGCLSFRVVHTDDIVPSLMPAVPVLWFADSRHHLFYAHAGVPVDFTVTQEVAVPDRQSLIMTNHAMTTYETALWQDDDARGALSIPSQTPS